jgi:hypothetical protein
VAENFELPHTFNKEKILAGKEMVLCFYAKKNAELSVRQPEATSLARAKGFNRDNVLHFFDLMESNITKFVFTPDMIFNVDEYGFSTVQKRPQEIVAQKEKYGVGEWRTRGHHHSGLRNKCCSCLHTAYDNH